MFIFSCILDENQSYRLDFVADASLCLVLDKIRSSYFRNVLCIYFYGLCCHDCNFKRPT